MPTPKILAKGKFHPYDLAVSVSESNRQIDPNIEIKIDQVWQVMLKEAQEQGRNCYNGFSYRLNSLNESNGKLAIDFSTIEYKIRESLMRIPEYSKLPEEFFRKGCYSISSVRTSDGYYLMVELSGKSMNKRRTDLIGGIMETDLPMDVGTDIFTSFYKELKEETNVEEEEIESSYLQTIFLSQTTNVAFYFEVVLNTSLAEILERFEKENKEPDIKSLKFFKKEEYLEILKGHPGQSKNFIASLLDI